MEWFALFYAYDHGFVSFLIGAIRHDLVDVYSTLIADLNDC
jgi:hypothetical protein